MDDSEFKKSLFLLYSQISIEIALTDPRINIFDEGFQKEIDQIAPLFGVTPFPMETLKQISIQLFRIQQALIEYIQISSEKRPLESWANWNQRVLEKEDLEYKKASRMLSFISGLQILLFLDTQNQNQISEFLFYFREFCQKYHKTLSFQDTCNYQRKIEDFLKRS